MLRAVMLGAGTDAKSDVTFANVVFGLYSLAKQRCGNLNKFRTYFHENIYVADSIGLFCESCESQLGNSHKLRAQVTKDGVVPTSLASPPAPFRLLPPSTARCCQLLPRPARYRPVPPFQCTPHHPILQYPARACSPCARGPSSAERNWHSRQL